MDMSLSELWELVMDMLGLEFCDSWGHKESDTTEWLNWTELMICESERETESRSVMFTFWDPMDCSPYNSLG